MIQVNHSLVMPREIGCFRFRSLNTCRSRHTCRSRPRPTSGEIGCFRFRSLNSFRSRPRPTSGESGCFRFRSLNSCRSRPRPTSGESGASSIPLAIEGNDAVPKTRVCDYWLARFCGRSQQRARRALILIPSSAHDRCLRRPRSGVARLGRG